MTLASTPARPGKTGFVRTLSGLWPLMKGSLDRPLNELGEVFVVPQRIHMVLGSLADQVTYPKVLDKAERTKAVEAELMALLGLVGGAAGRAVIPLRAALRCADRP